MSEEIGRVVKVAGPVVDVAFPQDNLPELNFALEVDITIGETKNTITLEVAQHIGENKVRAVSMQATDGLKRGTEVRNTNAPISVPVGQETLRTREGNDLFGEMQESGVIDKTALWQSISEMLKNKMFCYLLITFLDLARQVPRCQHCWDVCLQQLVISQH